MKFYIAQDLEKVIHSLVNKCLKQTFELLYAIGKNLCVTSLNRIRNRTVLDANTNKNSCRVAGSKQNFIFDEIHIAIIKITNTFRIPL